jgi:hypothetical protein
MREDSGIGEILEEVRDIERGASARLDMHEIVAGRNLEEAAPTSNNGIKQGPGLKSPEPKKAIMSRGGQGPGSRLILVRYSVQMQELDGVKDTGKKG